MSHITLDASKTFDTALHHGHQFANNNNNNNNNSGTGPHGWSLLRAVQVVAVVILAL